MLFVFATFSPEWFRFGLLNFQFRTRFPERTKTNQQRIERVVTLFPTIWMSMNGPQNDDVVSIFSLSLSLHLSIPNAGRFFSLSLVQRQTSDVKRPENSLQSSHVAVKSFIVASIAYGIWIDRIALSASERNFISQTHIHTRVGTMTMTTTSTTRDIVE